MSFYKTAGEGIKMDRFTAVIGCIFTAVIAVASVLQYRIFVKTDRAQYSTSRAYVFGGPGDRIKDPEGKFAGIILTYGNYGKTPGLFNALNAVRSERVSERA
jgi:type IV secretory pathway VirB4 component